MPRLTLIPTLVVLLATTAFAQPDALAIRSANVVDVETGEIAPDQTVLVVGDRIEAVGPDAEVDVPEDARVLDADGGYLIPGLWDMHSHIAREARIQPLSNLLIANGITGARDMWGSLAVAAEARAAIKAGDLAGPPRLVVAGNIVDGAAAPRPGFVVAGTPEEGRTVVDSLYAAGAPFLKVYTMLTPETYEAIVQRAGELGIPIAGHVPMLVSAADASDAGQRSFEHLIGIVGGCSDDAGGVMGQMKAFRAHLDAGDMRAVVAGFLDPIRLALDTQSEEACRRLFDRLIENGTWQVPTLTSLRGKAYLREIAAEGDPRTRYFTPLDRWTSGMPFGFPLTDDQWAVFQRQYEREKEIVGEMAAAGVPILAGSDMTTPWVVPGFGLHDELALLVDAGLTPLHALQAATLNPARFFNRTDELGTAEAGKLADLVLLDANPLDDIANTTQIRAVVADGRLYRRGDLDRLLAGVEASVAEVASAD